MAKLTLSFSDGKFEVPVDDRVLKALNDKAEILRIGKPFYLEARESVYKYETINQFTANYVNDARTACYHFVDKIIELLVDREIYDIDRDGFIEDLFDYYHIDDPIIESYQEIRQKLNGVDENVASAKNNLKLEKEMRGRVVGGGFGLTGAVKGMLTASAINSITGYLYDRDNRKAEEKLDQLASRYKSGMLQDAIDAGMKGIDTYFDMCILKYFRVIKLDNNELDKNTEKSNAITHNVLDGIIKPAKQMDAIIKAISLAPNNIDAYIYLTLKYGRNKSIDTIVDNLALNKEFEDKLAKLLRDDIESKDYKNFDFNASKNELIEIQKRLDRFEYNMLDLLPDSKNLQLLTDKISVDDIAFDNLDDYNEARKAFAVLKRHDDLTKTTKSRYDEICDLSKSALSKSGNVLLVYYQVLKQLIIDENKNNFDRFEYEIKPIYFDAIRKAHQLLLDRMATGEEMNDEGYKKQYDMYTILYKNGLAMDETYKDNLEKLIKATQEYKDKYGIDDIYKIQIQKLLEKTVYKLPLETTCKLELMTNHAYAALCKYFESTGYKPKERECHLSIREFVEKYIPEIDENNDSELCMSHKKPYLADLKQALIAKCDSFIELSKNDYNKMQELVNDIILGDRYEYLYTWCKYDNVDVKNLPLGFKEKKDISELRCLAQKYIIHDWAGEKYNGCTKLESWILDSKEYDNRGLKTAFDKAVKYEILPLGCEYNDVKSKIVAFVHPSKKFKFFGADEDDETIAYIFMYDALIIVGASKKYLGGTGGSGYFPYSKFNLDNISWFDADSDRNGCYDVEFKLQNDRKYEFRYFDHNVFALLHLLKSNFELKC